MIFVAEKYDRVINKSLSSIKVYYIRIKFFAESKMKVRFKEKKEQRKISNYYIRSYINTKYVDDSYQTTCNFWVLL